MRILFVLIFLFANLQSVSELFGNGKQSERWITQVSDAQSSRPKAGNVYFLEEECENDGGNEDPTETQPGSFTDPTAFGKRFGRSVSAGAKVRPGSHPWEQRRLYLWFGNFRI